MVYWIIHSDGERRQAFVNRTTVGRNISTKSVYGDYREDITANYKYPEGISLNLPASITQSFCIEDSSSSTIYSIIHCNFPLGSIMERQVYEKVGKHVLRQNGQTGKLEMSIKHAQAIHGTDFDVIVEVNNVGGEDMPAQLTVTSNAVTYNSLHRGECQRKTTKLLVPAQKGR